MYGHAELQADARGYGLVLYVAQGSTGTVPHPQFSPYASTFLHGLYAFVRTHRPITVYRAFGHDPTASARMLARFWSPARPSLAIDRLGYASAHNRLREQQSVLRRWNPLSEVVEAELAAGTEIFLGRTGKQESGGERYAGGDIQFFLNTRDQNGDFIDGLPEVSYQLQLKRRHGTGA